MLNLTHLSEAWRVFKRSRRVKRLGIRKYPGNAKEICQQIVKDCWNGRYFQVSTGHFCEFYMRDFGWSVDSLLKLGYRDKVLLTLAYALDIYSKQGLKTTITPSGKAIDVFTYSPDSLAFLIRSLRVANAKELVEEYKEFLIKEIDRFYNIVLDKETGLVRKDRLFSSIKDESKRKRSTYNNVMMAMLSNELDRLKLQNPLKSYNFKRAIKESLWSGAYFYDDISRAEIVTGDSNVFPFWTGVFDEKEMLKSAITQMQLHCLDKPFPLRYTKTKMEEKIKMLAIEVFVPNYERDTAWMHMGPLYVQLVKLIDKQKAREYIDAYTKIIERYKNFLEVFNPDGSPFKSPFYHADEGMLWAANYLTLLK